MVLGIEIRSTTDLSKRTKDVLDSASGGMVVIHRENPNADIAMLKHDTLKRIIAAHQLMPQIIGVLRYLTTFDEAQAASAPPADFDWLSAFDADDLREFSVEYLGTAIRVIQGDLPASALEDTITQWRRSAEVLLDDDLRARLQQERSLILEG